jgi:hypothetical protein
MRGLERSLISTTQRPKRRSNAMPLRKFAPSLARPEGGRSRPAKKHQLERRGDRPLFAHQTRPADWRLSVGPERKIPLGEKLMKRSIGRAMLVIALTGFATLAGAQMPSAPWPHYTVVKRMGQRGCLPDGQSDRRTDVDDYRVVGPRIIDHNPCRSGRIGSAARIGNRSTFDPE